MWIGLGGASGPPELLLQLASCAWDAGRRRGGCLRRSSCACWFDEVIRRGRPARAAGLAPEICRRGLGAAGDDRPALSAFGGRNVMEVPEADLHCGGASGRV